MKVKDVSSCCFYSHLNIGLIITELDSMNSYAIFQVSATVFITIEDINDNRPAFQNTPYQKSVSEVSVKPTDEPNK